LLVSRHHADAAATALLRRSRRFPG
jgi:hypothetical protein